MSFGHGRRDALISAAFEAIEDTTSHVPSYPDHTIVSYDRDATLDSCSIALVSLGNDTNDDTLGGDGYENARKSPRIPNEGVKADKKSATSSHVQRLLSRKKQYDNTPRQGLSVQSDAHRPWKVKALAALSHLTVLEQQCFDAERRVCELQAKHDALVLERSDMEVECERYRAAWGDAVGRMDAMELKVRILQGRLNMYEDRAEPAEKQEDEEDTEVDDVVKNILLRGKENMAKHAETKIREDVEEEYRKNVKEEVVRVEDAYRQTVSQLESELAEMEIALTASHQENATLQDTVRGLEEHVLHAQSRVVQLQEENDYYASFVDTNTAQTQDEDDVFKDAVWELKQEVREREEELLAMQECLNEEKARSNGLHEQILRQVMELEDLRKAACRTRELEEELKALRHVHAQTLKDMAELKLVQTMNDKKTQGEYHKSSPSPSPLRPQGNPFVDDESWLM